jgi:hypothetical protein
MPDFVVLGAQKSASTFLQDQLSQHPSIEIAAGEARHFEDPEYARGAVDALPGLFTRTGPGIRRGIKRPDYLGRPEVPERLHRHIPDARLFAVIREPVSRAVSAYFHYVRHGFVPLLPLDEAFTALLDGGLGDQYPRSGEILSYGLYGHHLQAYGEYFARDKIMVLHQNTLIQDPVTSLRAAFEFLDVDPTFEPRRTTAVSNRGVYWAPRLRLLRSKNHAMYRYTPTLDRRYPRRPSPMGWFWNASVVTIDRQVLARLDHSPTPRLTGELLARTQEFYAADTEVLREFLAPELGSIPWASD